jgi:hypothetical protein
MGLMCSYITQRSSETVTGHCRKEIRSNSRSCKAPKVPKLRMSPRATRLIEICKRRPAGGTTSAGFLFAAMLGAERKLG